MKLPPPPQVWTSGHAREVYRQVEQSDQENHKRGRDIEVGDARIILTAPDGGRWSIEVDNAGNLSASSV